MTTTGSEVPWVHYDEAMSLIRTFNDPALEQFVMRAVTIVVQNYSKGVAPSAPLDMVYFVNTLVELFGQRRALARILAGEDLRWWGDD
ncbi:MAG TPA: hypothetical protein VM493_07585 [Vicinamibacterales bacterium]|jgi:hypothetical protein|nr:hypothetical protein [Vicinamibacterales bacterium]